MTPRIGILSGSWPPIKCGVGDFCYRLAAEMAAQGRQVEVVTDRGGLVPAPAGVSVRPAVGSWFPLALPQILLGLRAADPAVVNLHYPTVSYSRISAIDLVPALARTILRVPVVSTIHEYTTFHRSGRLRVEALVRASNAAIVPDPVNRAAIARAIPSAADRLLAIPLGPPIDPAPPAGFDRTVWRSARGLSPGTVVLAYFGFVSPGKGIEMLIDAFDRLPPDPPTKLWLVADRQPSVPRYARYHSAIEERLSRSSRSAAVSWTGYLPAAEVSEYLAAADLAILPYDDGATLRRTTMLTALAHGLPVVSTGERPPCGGVRVVPVGDLEALVEEIQTLAADPAARQRLAGEAATAAAQFSWPQIACDTLAALDKVSR